MDLCDDENCVPCTLRRAILKAYDATDEDPFLTLAGTMAALREVLESKDVEVVEYNFPDENGGTLH